MISDHGREARFPFLDEAVVQYLSTLPLSAKVTPKVVHRFYKNVAQKVDS